MPLGKIDLHPGVNLELTPTKNEGGWSDSQLIRFFSGQLQKLGGWAKLAGVGQLQGVCRGLFAWADLLGTPYLAAGTEQRLYVINGGLLQDITPVSSISNVTPAFGTTAGSSIVSVNDGSASPNVNDTIKIATQTAIGGLILFGFYPVLASASSSTYSIDAGSPATLTQSGGAVAQFTTSAGSATVTVRLLAFNIQLGGNYQVLLSTTVGGIAIFGTYSVASIQDSNTFTIVAASAAVSTATVSENSGNVSIEYLIPSGVGVNTSLSGWGAGDWGAGDWGLANAESVLVAKARTWSLDHFGQDLIASPDLGKIYHWSPPNATPSVVVDASAPTQNRVVFAMSQAQIIIASGSSVGNDYFPTLIRWCDSGDFTDWVATVDNLAGSFQLPTGSFITSALAIGLEALIWTDANLWAMQFIGAPFVFSFNQIGVACEALSKKAPAVFGNTVIWPSTHGWFVYSGGVVEPIPCPVWDYFYQNLDTTQSDQVFSAVNTLFSEVAWYFPMMTGEIGYVKMNYSSSQGSWDKGILTRTAWFDHSAFGNPVGADGNNFLQQHEVGNDADGVPMVSYAQSGFYDLQSGNEMMYVNMIIPDFKSSDASQINITVLATDYPGQAVRSYGPYTLTPTTTRINTSLRGRQVAFRVESEDPSSFWRMGAVRFTAAPAGRRP